MAKNVEKRFPLQCPSCNQSLAVRSLVCEGCKTEVQGMYPLPLLTRLSREDQEFIVEFVKLSGSLKEMASLLNVSYPTVRNRLDEIVRDLSKEEKS
jgi:hypothetical protein